MSFINVKYLTASDVMNINHTLTAGESGVRDIHLLHTAIRRPALVVFGEEQFRTIAEKAAALMHSLAYHHLFFDGNKRTAVEAVTWFLNRNGYDFDYNMARDYEFVLEIAQGKRDVPEIAAWIEGQMREKPIDD
jgi:death on curing protein